MKVRRLLTLVLTLGLLLALSLPAQAADLTYEVSGGKLYFDATTVPSPVQMRPSPRRTSPLRSTV